jgi:hypothetical protein
MMAMFSTTLVDLSRVVKPSWRPYRNLSNTSRERNVWKIDCTRYGLSLRVSIVVHWQGHGRLFRYCIPMDNDRPSLDLKYFDAVCPDKNGMSISKQELSTDRDWHHYVEF